MLAYEDRIASHEQPIIINLNLYVLDKPSASSSSTNFSDAYHDSLHFSPQLCKFENCRAIVRQCLRASERDGCFPNILGKPQSSSLTEPKRW